MFSHLIKIVIAISFIVGCAKRRAVEKDKDVEGDVQAKSLYTGANPDGTFWMSKVTMTKTSSNGGFGFVGLQSDAKVGYFEFTKDKIKYYNAVTPFGKLSVSTAPELLNSWDIKHYDRKLGETNGNPTNKEVEDKDKNWQSKQYFKIDFEKADISEGATFPYYIDWATYGQCWSAKTKYLVDGSKNISADYISFTIGVDYQVMSLCPDSIRRHIRGDFTYTVHYTYSFKKVTKSDYKPYVYKSEEDPIMAKYGYFQTVLEKMDPKTNMLKNQILMNRFHPNKTHTFYYAKGGPEKYYKMFDEKNPRSIFAKTNKVFEEAGVGIRFQVKPYNDGGVERKFGDIRYSFIKFIDEMDVGAPLGYGPSDPNPLTGEIQAANLVIWTGYLKYYAKLMADMPAQEKDKFQKSSLFGKMAERMAEGNGQAQAQLSAGQGWANHFDQSKGVGKSFHQILPNVTYGYPGWARFTYKEAPENQKESHTSLEKIGGFVHNQDQLAKFKQIHQIADKANHMRKHRHDSKSGCLFPVEQGLADVESLIPALTEEQLIEAVVYRTAIHELGHNLGLRHNFYGTVDSQNFDTEKVAAHDLDGNPILHKETKEPVMWKSGSSSVMDYIGLKHEADMPYTWDRYDRAALMYAYSGGTSQHPEVARDYLFCTDEHTVLNALCNRFDFGNSPSEIAMSIIESYEARYHRRNYRFNRAYWNTSSYASRVYGTMRTLKKFIPLWRRAFSDKNYVRYGLKGEQKALDNEMRHTLKLVMSFYEAVIQQSSAERPYDDLYAVRSGELEQIGILWDKIFAMLFLAGDDAFMYAPSEPMSKWSFMTFADDPQLEPMITDVFKGVVTQRVAMKPWFLGFGQVLYALNATSFYHEDNASLIRNIEVKSYSKMEFENGFGLKLAKVLPPGKIVNKITLGNKTVDNFVPNETVGVANINGSIKVVSRDASPYSFSIINEMLTGVEFDNSIVQEKKNLTYLQEIFDFFSVR